ncbi:hypothetical protein GN958_ATG06385 [Phytophthora infestans]|uniref:Uncharacterized protein n=1 Tax=Phytophthora infestans TaxID=4787 RepID=A0A8S9V1Y0_PHYIN|nr:hypothetical protein GN958_ATG06385 [Phytophthora infestans]
MASYPAIRPTDVFNTSLFTKSTDGLTLANADQRYIRSGSTATVLSLSCSSLADVGSLKIGGATVDLTPISGVTAGTALGGKALIVDSSRNIANLNNVTCSGLADVGSLKIGGTAVDLSPISGVTAGRI